MARMLAFALAVTLTLAACTDVSPGPSPLATEPPSVAESSSAAPDGAWEDTPEQQFFREMAFNAEYEGSSQAQIDVLIEAGRRGALDPQRVEDLLPPFFACLADAGAAGVTLPAIEVAPGLAYVDYRIDYPAGDGELKAELERAVFDCELEHFAFAWQAVNRQPAVQ
ncbi:MAG: hypothetical protein CVT64_08545 [Actinobacteria bacterium HGW-Actinobacteria-4]|nr:MAG: hypothetical protein CVT64_08545 [Actinobacteria bacterium HGW-Actinobacteria-4]